MVLTLFQITVFCMFTTIFERIISMRIMALSLNSWIFIILFV